MRKKNGFTLTEVLAVVSILAAVMIIATPIVMNTLGKSKKIIREEDRKTALDSVKTYLADIENGTVKYKAPGIVEINGHVYTAGTEMKTYDAISYIISKSVDEGIEIPVTTLVSGGYLDSNCDYENHPNKCKFKSTCIFKGYMDGDTQDGYNVVKKYRSEFGTNCD